MVLGAVLDDDAASAVFAQMKLTSDELDELDKKLVDAGEEPRHAGGPAVMDAAQLRLAFAELGDTVEGADLFALVQQADPDGDGVVPLERFLGVISVRREQVERARREKELVEAYVALGGSEDRDKTVASEYLVAITQDFVGEEAAAAALKSVVAHKMKAVQEGEWHASRTRALAINTETTRPATPAVSVLDMGGALDEEEEEELKDTTKLTFEEVKAYAEGLRALGLTVAGELPSAATEGEVLR